MMHNNSVERDVPKLRFGFPPPAAPAAPHVKRYVHAAQKQGEIYANNYM